MSEENRDPIAFIGKGGSVKMKSKKYISADGTPRYIINPRSPQCTFCLQDCMEEWMPVYNRQELSAYMKKK